MSSGFRLLTEAELRDRGAKKWTQYAPDVLPMWIAEMDFAAATPIQAAVERTTAKQVYGYPGNEHELIRAYTGWTSRALGVEANPDWMLVIPDVLRGVELGIEVFSPPGTPVVLPSPAYMPFWQVPGVVGREIVTVPMTTDELGRPALDLVAIEDAFAAGARSMILCQPYNPLGRVFTADELRPLAEVAERHDAWIISDEIHAPLVIATGDDPRTPAGAYARTVPFASVSPAAAARCVTVASGSKAWNLPGLRCAVLMVHTEQAWRHWQSTRPELKIYGASTFGIAANTAAFTDGEEWLTECLHQLDANGRWLEEFLARELPQVRYRRPEGTYLTWLDLRPLDLPVEPGPWLLEHAKVACNAGPAFGPGGAGHVRMNIATSPEILAEGCRRIAEALARR